MYQKVTADNAGSIVAGLHGGDVKAERLDTGGPFFALQASVILENSGVIEPERIESYIAADGYQALEKAVSDMEPQEVIEEITRSGLRGRGGAGYPTGLKWATVAKQPGAKKYVVCNADEGDPGAFMNRSVLESDPHKVLEGMAIAGYAVGAQQGYIYVRGEYPLAIERLKVALKQAGQRGLLGARLFGTPLDFRIDIRIGAGAFVCGEETALMASIMGERGYPRPRPPYPAESGLWGCPTLLNNVETFANVPPIIRRGAAWFASMGTRAQQGYQGLLGHRQSEEHRAGRGAARHHHAHHCGDDRRRLAEGHDQGRADRRTVRRLHLRGVSGHASRLRIAAKPRLDHGLRRHDRHGPGQQHGGRGPLLHDLLHGRIVRRVHPLPRRHRADDPPAHQDPRRQGQPPRPERPGGTVRHGSAHQPVRPWPNRAESSAEHVAVISGTSMRRC